MTIRLERAVRTMILIGSLLMLSACATLNTAETTSNETQEEIARKSEDANINKAREIAREAAEKEAADRAALAENAKEADTVKKKEPEKAVSQGTEAADKQNTNVARIKLKEKYVNVRPLPTTKKRPVAVLKGGTQVEILEENEAGWLKIKWQKGETTKEGWVKKGLVE